MSPSTDPICAGNLSSAHAAINFDTPCEFPLNVDALDSLSTTDFAVFAVVLSTAVFGIVWVSNSLLDLPCSLKSAADNDVLDVVYIPRSLPKHSSFKTTVHTSSRKPNHPCIERITTKIDC